MLYQEHLAKLNEGVKAWNHWREKNSNIMSIPNLIRADLSGLNLQDANLQDANLQDANLQDANLRNGQLKDTHLSSANLSGTNLSGADLSDADLSDADLREADLSGADLSDADFREADLSGADLSDADLREADLSGADLIEANLSGANLQDADLSGADLSGADLSGADLSGADLSGANLYGVNLSGLNLPRIQALGTNFEGATLTGACIMDWNINSQTNLQNVQCDYIFLKRFYYKKEKKWIYSDRVPHDSDKIFAPGEFTKRYQKILETVNLYFGEGIDWQVFLNSFQKLQEEEKIKIADGEREIPIVQGIEKTGDGSFVIKVGVSPDTDKGEIEKSFWQKYQRQLKEAEEKYRLELNFKEEQIQFYRQNYTEVLEIIKLTASQPINITQHQGDKNVNDNRETKIDKYFKTEKAGIVYNKGNISGDIKVAEVINEAAQQDLAQAAADIQQLLDQLSQTYPTATFAEKGAVADKTIEEIKNNPTLLRKVINVIKAMGIEALAEAVDNPIFNIAKAGIEAALELES